METMKIRSEFIITYTNTKIDIARMASRLLLDRYVGLLITATSTIYLIGLVGKI